MNINNTHYYEKNDCLIEYNLMPKTLGVLQKVINYGHLKVIVLLLCLSPLGSMAQIGTYNLQFDSPSYDANAGTFCIDMQIQSGSELDILIGNYGIWGGFNPNALSGISYTPVNFAPNTSGCNLYDELTDDFFDENGLYIISGTILPDNMVCDLVDQEWVTIGTLCFEVINSNEPMNLVFDAPSFDGTDFYGAIDEHIRGSFGEYNCTANDAIVTIIPSNTSASFCEGDSIDLDAGFGYMNYIWQNSLGENVGSSHIIPVNSADIYSVTVTAANGCTAVDSILVEQLDIPEIMISGSASFCEGGSTTLTATDGYDTYLWHQDGMLLSELGSSLTVFTSGDYSVQIFGGNGCANEDTVNVIETDALTPIITGDLTFCEGDSTILDAGLFDNYEWSTGEMTQAITVDAIGEYTVTVSNGDGCLGDTMVFVTQNNPIIPTFNDFNIYLLPVGQTSLDISLSDLSSTPIEQNDLGSFVNSGTGIINGGTLTYTPPSASFSGLDSALITLCETVCDSCNEAWLAVDVAVSTTPPIVITPIEDLEDATSLVIDSLFGTNGCFDITNIEAIGSPLAIGSFSDGLEAIGMENGIVFSTGNVIDAVGPNMELSIDSDASTGLGTGGDGDLFSLSGGATNDATGIEFEFTPTNSGTVEFDFVFASEGYPEWVGSAFGDVFGLFVAGGQFTDVTNIALVPNTPDIITLNTINETTNSNYYNENPLGGSIEYDGYTSVLTAILDVEACETYSIKLVIGDAGDDILDSGVFLKANTTGLTAEDAVLVTSGNPNSSGVFEGCGATFVFERENTDDISQAITANIVIDPSSTATEGVDFESLPSTIIIPAGEDSVELFVLTTADIEDEGEGEPLTITTDKACDCESISATIIIKDSEPLSIDLAADGNFVNQVSICQGESVELIGSYTGGVDMVNFGWEDNIGEDIITVTPTTTTTYVFLVQDGCFNSAVGEMTVNILPPTDPDCQSVGCEIAITDICTSPDTDEVVVEIAYNTPQNNDTISLNVNNGTYQEDFANITGDDILTVSVPASNFTLGVDNTVSVSFTQLSECTTDTTFIPDNLPECIDCPDLIAPVFDLENAPSFFCQGENINVTNYIIEGYVFSDTLDYSYFITHAGEDTILNPATNGLFDDEEGAFCIYAVVALNGFNIDTYQDSTISTMMEMAAVFCVDTSIAYCFEVYSQPEILELDTIICIDDVSKVVLANNVSNEVYWYDSPEAYNAEIPYYTGVPLELTAGEIGQYIVVQEVNGCFSEPSLITIDAEDFEGCDGCGIFTTWLDLGQCDNSTGTQIYPVSILVEYANQSSDSLYFSFADEDTVIHTNDLLSGDTLFWNLPLETAPIDLDVHFGTEEITSCSYALSLQITCTDCFNTGILESFPSIQCLEQTDNAVVEVETEASGETTTYLQVESNTGIIKSQNASGIFQNDAIGDYCIYAIDYNPLEVDWVIMIEITLLSDIQADNLSNCVALSEPVCYTVVYIPETPEINNNCEDNNTIILSIDSNLYPYDSLFWFNNEPVLSLLDNSTFGPASQAANQSDNHPNYHTTTGDTLYAITYKNGCRSDTASFVVTAAMIVACSDSPCAGIIVPVPELEQPDCVDGIVTINAIDLEDGALVTWVVNETEDVTETGSTYTYSGMMSATIAASQTVDGCESDTTTITVEACVSPCTTLQAPILLQGNCINGEIAIEASGVLGNATITWVINGDTINNTSNEYIATAADSIVVYQTLEALNCQGPNDTLVINTMDFEDCVNECVVDAGQDTIICSTSPQYTYGLSAIISPIGTSGEWFIAVNEGIIQITTTTNPNSTVMLDGYGTYILFWTCDGSSISDSITIELAPQPFAGIYPMDADSIRYICDDEPLVLFPDSEITLLDEYEIEYQIIDFEEDTLVRSEVYQQFASTVNLGAVNESDLNLGILYKVQAIVGHIEEDMQLCGKDTSVIGYYQFDKIDTLAISCSINENNPNQIFLSDATLNLTDGRELEVTIGNGNPATEDTTFFVSYGTDLFYIDPPYEINYIQVQDTLTGCSAPELIYVRPDAGQFNYPDTLDWCVSDINPVADLGDYLSQQPVINGLIDQWSFQIFSITDPVFIVNDVPQVITNEYLSNLQSNFGLFEGETYGVRAILERDLENCAIWISDTLYFSYCPCIVSEASMGSGYNTEVQYLCNEMPLEVTSATNATWGANYQVEYQLINTENDSIVKNETRTDLMPMSFGSITDSDNEALDVGILYEVIAIVGRSDNALLCEQDTTIMGYYQFDRIDSLTVDCSFVSPDEIFLSDATLNLTDGRELEVTIINGNPTIDEDTTFIVNYGSELFSIKPPYNINYIQVQDLTTGCSAPELIHIRPDAGQFNYPDTLDLCPNNMEVSETDINDYLTVQAIMDNAIDELNYEIFDLNFPSSGPIVILPAEDAIITDSLLLDLDLAEGGLYGIRATLNRISSGCEDLNLVSDTLLFSFSELCNCHPSLDSLAMLAATSQIVYVPFETDTIRVSIDSLLTFGLDLPANITVEPTGFITSYEGFIQGPNGSFTQYVEYITEADTIKEIIKEADFINDTITYIFPSQYIYANTDTLKVNYINNCGQIVEGIILLYIECPNKPIPAIRFGSNQADTEDCTIWEISPDTEDNQFNLSDLQWCIFDENDQIIDCDLVGTSSILLEGEQVYTFGVYPDSSRVISNRPDEICMVDSTFYLPGRLEVQSLQTDEYRCIHRFSITGGSLPFFNGLDYLENNFPYIIYLNDSLIVHGTERMPNANIFNWNFNANTTTYDCELAINSFKSTYLLDAPFDLYVTDIPNEMDTVAYYCEANLPIEELICNPEQPNISILPNPNKGIFQVTLDNVPVDADISIQVVNMLGQVVFSTIRAQENERVFLFDLNTLSDGIYLMYFNVESELFDDKCFVEKFIKQ